MYHPGGLHNKEDNIVGFISGSHITLCCPTFLSYLWYAVRETYFKIILPIMYAPIMYAPERLRYDNGTQRLSFLNMTLPHLSRESKWHPF